MDSSEETLSVVMSGVGGAPDGNLYDLFTDFDGVCVYLALPGVLGVPGIVGCRGKEKGFIACDSTIVEVED